MNAKDSNSKQEIREGDSQSKRDIRQTYRPANASKSGSICIRRSGHAYCPMCQKLVVLLTFSAAAKSFNTDVPDIEILAQQGDLHRLHNRFGEVMICSDSLFRCFDTRPTRLLDSGLLVCRTTD